MKKKTFKKLLFFFVNLGAILSFLSFKAVASIERESPQELGFITAGEYASFLNQEAVLDLDGFYDEKMSLEEGSIRRLGEPGSYCYEVALGKEFQPVCFLNHHMSERYAFWKGMDIHASAFLQADQDLKINQEASTLPVMEMAGEGIIATTVWQRLLKFLFITSLLANSRGQMVNEDQPIMDEAVIDHTGESLIQQETRIEGGNFSGPVVFGGNVTIHYHDLEPALGEFEKQGKDLAEMRERIEELYQLIGTLVQQQSPSEKVKEAQKQAEELEKKEGAIKQKQVQLANQIQGALAEEELTLRESIKLGKREALHEAAQWCYSCEVVNKQLNQYGSQHHAGTGKEVVSFGPANPFYLFCPDIEKLFREEERLRLLEATLRNKETDLGEQDEIIKNQRITLQQEQALWEEEKTTLARRIAFWELEEKKQKIESLMQEASVRGEEVNDLLERLEVSDSSFSLWNEVDHKVKQVKLLWDEVINIIKAAKEVASGIFKRSWGDIDVLLPLVRKLEYAEVQGKLWTEKVEKLPEDHENREHRLKRKAAEQIYLEAQEKDRAAQQAFQKVELFTGEEAISFWKKVLEEASFANSSWVNAETVFKQSYEEASTRLKIYWKKDLLTIQDSKTTAALRGLFYKAKAKNSLLELIRKQATEAHQQRFYDQAIQLWNKAIPEIDTLLRTWKELRIEAEAAYKKVSELEKRKIGAFITKAEQAETFWSNQVTEYNNQEKESSRAQEQEDLNLENFQISLHDAEDYSASVANKWTKIKNFPEEEVLNELIASAKQASDRWNKVLSFKSYELPYNAATSYQKNRERALRQKELWDRKIQKMSNTTIAAHAIFLGKAAAAFAQVTKDNDQLKVEVALKALSTEVDQFTRAILETTEILNAFFYESEQREHLQELNTRIQESLKKGFPCTSTDVFYAVLRGPIVGAMDAAIQGFVTGSVASQIIRGSKDTYYNLFLHGMLRAFHMALGGALVGPLIGSIHSANNNPLLKLARGAIVGTLRSFSFSYFFTAMGYLNSKYHVRIVDDNLFRGAAGTMIFAPRTAPILGIVRGIADAGNGAFEKIIMGASVGAAGGVVLWKSNVFGPCIPASDYGIFYKGTPGGAMAGMIAGGGVALLDDLIKKVSQTYRWEWNGGLWDACRLTTVQHSILSGIAEITAKIIEASELAAKRGWREEEVWLSTLLQQITDFSEHIAKK